jgi:predicted ferric reductase
VVRKTLIWIGVAVVISVPLAVAVDSPLLAWRSPVYIIAGFAGVVSLALLFVQPLLIGGHLFGPRHKQRVHRWIGAVLIGAVVVHVGGLWLTSPPDVIDALLLRSPTPFSLWGVIAMWAIFATGILAIFRHRIGVRRWRLTHTTFAVVIVGGSVVHALLIEGTMGTVSKAILCALVIAALGKVMVDRRVWTLRKRPQG